MARFSCDTDSGADRTEAHIPAPHRAVSPGRTHTIEGAPGISLGGKHTAAHSPALLRADSPARAYVVAAAYMHMHAGVQGVWGFGRVAWDTG